jgi:DNA-binding transcriptional ArsR family regulator
MKINAENLAAQCDTVAGLLKSISHPQRLKILCLLCEGELSVSDIEAYCGASQSMVSTYLAKMKSEGLIVSRREGKRIYYSIDRADLVKMMQAMQKIFCT